MKLDDMSNVNRNTIKRIKKDLVLKDERYADLRKKFLGSNEDQECQFTVDKDEDDSEMDDSEISETNETALSVSSHASTNSSEETDQNWFSMLDVE